MRPYAVLGEGEREVVQRQDGRNESTLAGGYIKKIQNRLGVSGRIK